MKTFSIPRFIGGFLGRLHWLPVVFLLSWFFFSCGEPDEIGLTLIDSRASFSSTDTLTIRVFSAEADPIPTNLGVQNIIGVMNDPVFGKIKSGIYTEFRLPRNEFSLGEDPKLDSIVLSFGYSGKFYGQETTFQRIRVYELSENFPDLDTLYSDLFIPHYPVPIGERLLRPAPVDSIAIDTLMYAPHFTMRLSDEFGQKIIDANGTDAFRDIPGFLDYFKGLYIVPDDDIDGIGSIFNINMFSGFTRLTLFYNLGGENSLRHDFFINEFTKRSNYIQNLGTGQADPLLQQQLSGQNPEIYGDSLLFLQSMGRVNGRIQIPYINELRTLQGVTINQAKLILPLAPGFDNETFPAARQIALFKLNQDGRISFLSDQFFGDEYFGGVLNAEERQYHFNITSHLQRLIDGKEEDYGMVLYVSWSSDSAERIVLKGPGVSQNPIRLEIVYTML